MRRIRALIALLALAMLAAACSSTSDEEAAVEDDGDATVGQVDFDAVYDELSDLPFADPAVRYLEHALSDLGYAVSVDGVFGPDTVNALADFQADEGLEVTGYLDAETIVALEEQSDEVEHLLVEVLQTQLAELGLYTDPIDGVWGPASEGALTAFQGEVEIPTTGRLDEFTFAKLVMEYDERVIAEHTEGSADVGRRSTIPEGEEGEYLREGDQGTEVQALQERLTELGYRPGVEDGNFGAHTVSAVLAFQKREGLQRDAIVGPEVLSRLEDPQGAGPRSDAPGPRVEVDLDRQVLFVIAADGSVTTLNTSTGSGREFQSAEPGKGIVVAHTPVGEFEILRVIDGLREAPLGTLYRPMYFTSEGGFAIHGNPHVPGYPASHGCARLANYDMDYLWDTGLGVDDAVWVYGDNPPPPPNAAGGF